MVLKCSISTSNASGSITFALKISFVGEDKIRFCRATYRFTRTRW